MEDQDKVDRSASSGELEELSTDERLLKEHMPGAHTGSPPQQNRSAWRKIRAGIPAEWMLLKRLVPPAPASLTPMDIFEEPLPAPDLSVEVAKWTRRRDIPLAILAWAAVVLLFFWLTSYVVQTILLLVIAALLAYAFAPLVTVLARLMPRVVAILIVYVVVLSGMGFLLYLVVQSVVEQITALTHSVGHLVTPTHPGQLTPLEQLLKPLGISPSQIASARAQLVTQLEGLAGSIVPLLTGVANVALDVIVVLILSIYLLLDGSEIVAWLRHGLPRSQRSRVRYSLNTMQRIVGGYIRGQLIMSTLMGVLVGVGLLIIGIPYALLLGVLAFFLEFIPTLGMLTSGAICVLVALSRGWVSALIVLVYFILVHIFEGDVVGPRIVGKAVGLHPIVSLVALIAGAELFGIGGALFASPVAGILQAVIVTLWTEWREAHREAFQAARPPVTAVATQKQADQPLDPDPPQHPDVTS